MKTSIVMATWNGATYLSAQLESLASQTLLPDELLVGDDASEDETPDIVARFARSVPFPVVLRRNGDRQGYARNFIATARQARGDLLLFCDQDDIWHADKLATVVGLAEGSGADMVSHDLAIELEEIAATIIPSYFAHLDGLGLPVDVCCKGCALAVRATFLQQWGWPSPTSGMSHDAWIGLLGTALGSRAHIAVPLVRHRIHQTNTSGWIVTAADVAARVTLPSEGEPPSVWARTLDFYLSAKTMRRWIDALDQVFRDHAASVDAALLATILDDIARVRASKFG